MIDLTMAPAMTPDSNHMFNHASSHGSNNRSQNRTARGCFHNRFHTGSRHGSLLTADTSTVEDEDVAGGEQSGAVGPPAASQLRPVRPPSYHPAPTTQLPWAQVGT
jgi:hypothetical protein